MSRSGCVVASVAVAVSLLWLALIVDLAADIPPRDLAVLPAIFGFTVGVGSVYLITDRPRRDEGGRRERTEERERRKAERRRRREARRSERIRRKREAGP